MAASDPVVLGGLTTVSSPPSTPTAGTTVTVTDASEYPDPASVGAYNATIWPNGANPIFSGSSRNAERVRITGKSGAVLTITRAQESTTARTVVAGDQIAPAIAGLNYVDLADSGTSSSITNSTTETILYNPTSQPAGSFKVGNVMRLKSGLLLINGSGGAITFTLRVYFGEFGASQVVVATIAISVPAGKTYYANVTSEILSVSSGAQESDTEIRFYNTTDAASVIAPIVLGNLTHDAATYKTGFGLTGQMGTASALAFFQSYLSFTEYLRS